MMKKMFKVLLRGENFLVESGGSIQKLGFFATRFVQAGSESEAELLAVAVVKGDAGLAKAVLNERNDPPMINIEEVKPLDAPDGPGSGYSFFSLNETARAPKP
jgi:hypothetical protein